MWVDPNSRWYKRHADIAAGKFALGAVVRLGGQGRATLGTHMIGPGRGSFLSLTGRLQKGRKTDDRPQKIEGI